jgi:hypothetical protein
MKLLSKKKTKEQRLEASMAIKSISASVSLVANSRLGIVNYNPRNIRRDIWSNAATTDTPFPIALVAALRSSCRS